jgi:peroxiredoxin
LESHAKFAKKLGLSFPLVVDNGDISDLYDSGRITYLIDRSGIIRYLSRGMPINDKLLREIDFLQSP